MFDPTTKIIADQHELNKNHTKTIQIFSFIVVFSKRTSKWQSLQEKFYTNQIQFLRKFTNKQNKLFSDSTRGMRVYITSNELYWNLKLYWQYFNAYFVYLRSISPQQNTFKTASSVSIDFHTLNRITECFSKVSQRICRIELDERQLLWLLWKDNAIIM